MERQLTHAPHGHILTNANVWSHDGAWIVYDVRSDAAGDLFDGTHIERVHVETGAVEVLYESRRGACCGVVSASPVGDRVAFILGPEDPTPDWQYSACHRRGVLVEAGRPGAVRNIDARNLTPPFTPGALRGGSHVHIFSGDGQWISFTYEDHVLAARGAVASGDLNQRNVGVSAPLGPVHVPRAHPRNHDGDYFTVLVTHTTNRPRPGSDEISRAYEDAWVGTRGYLRADGSRQTRALAFLGDVAGEYGGRLTELFIVDLPDEPQDLTRPGATPLEGTADRRPAPPAGVAQRRLTRTADRAHPGVQGVRHWPRSSPDGSQIAFLMRDDAGRVQLWSVSPLGGPVRQITDGPWDVASAFTWDMAGGLIAFVADGSVMVVEAASGRTRRITDPAAAGEAPRPEACVFSADGRQIAYVRPVERAGRRFNQVFVCDASSAVP
jgi:hypothetical protein